MALALNVGRPARIYVADLPWDAEAKGGVIERIQREAQSDDGYNDGKHEPTEVRFLDLHLTGFENVRKCAAEFFAQEERLDIIVLNAGIIGNRQAGADVRVVIVSSQGHAVALVGGIQFDKLKTDCADMSYAQRYGQSKLALIGLARELTQHYPSLTTASVRPGRILTGMATALGKESLMVRLTAPLAPLVFVSVAIGIKNHLWAATNPNIVSGKYYEPVGVPDKEKR
ncbi:hypothetical protein RRF57_000635 [Xylaria bambusicola]|uniref:Uncharacterized protein n=1 Tax=Xylaria bambusicola TaxID=326684 RepID=A0AAN7UNZ7_9PEZI